MRSFDRAEGFHGRSPPVYEPGPVLCGWVLYNSSIENSLNSGLHNHSTHKWITHQLQIVVNDEEKKCHELHLHLHLQGIWQALSSNATYNQYICRKNVYKPHSHLFIIYIYI